MTERDDSEVAASNLIDAITTGDRLKTLVALRDFLVLELANARYTKDYAPLSKELRTVLSEIESMRAPNSKDEVDELNQRRDARRKGATGT